jgi:predicted glycosyltransferase
MDLIKLNKKALLIPTPGQSEQLYLAQHLQEMNRFIARSQETVSLAEDIKTCRDSSATMMKVDFAEYKNALGEILDL